MGTLLTDNEESAESRFFKGHHTILHYRMTLLSSHHWHGIFHHDDYYNVRITHIIFIHLKYREEMNLRNEKLISQIICHR